jgi:hypothetical protein
VSADGATTGRCRQQLGAEAHAERGDPELHRGLQQLELGVARGERCAPRVAVPFGVRVLGPAHDDQRVDLAQAAEVGERVATDEARVDAHAGPHERVGDGERLLDGDVLDHECVGHQRRASPSRKNARAVPWSRATS